MKRIMLILLTLAAFAVIAQDTKVNVYGKFRFDYDLSKSDLDADKKVVSGFNIAKAEAGFKWTMSEELKSGFKYDFRENTISTVYADWMVNEAFTLSFGRIGGAFGPESNWGSEDFEAISAAFELGVASATLQLGNNGDTGLIIIPALSITPDLADVSLTAGVNARYNSEYAYVDTDAKPQVQDAVVDLNLFLTFGLADFSSKISTELNNLEDKMSVRLNTDVNYTVSDVNFGVTPVFHNVVKDGSELQIDTELYLSAPLTDGLKLKAIADLDNVNEAEGKLDYTFTIRFEFNPSYDF